MWGPLAVMKFIDDLEWNLKVLVIEIARPAIVEEALQSPLALIVLKQIVNYDKYPTLDKLVVRMMRLVRKTFNELRLYAIDELGLVGLFFNL